MPIIPVSPVIHLALTSTLSVGWAIVALRLFRIGHAGARRGVLAASILLPVAGFIAHLIYPWNCPTPGGLGSHFACLTSSSLGSAGTALLASSVTVAISQGWVTWAAQRRAFRSAVPLHAFHWDDREAGAVTRRAVEEVEDAAGVSLPVLITSVPGICCAAGIVNPSILISRDFCRSLDPEELKAALAHEMAHVMRKDTRVGLASALFRALTFFSPAAYVGIRLYREEREKAADDLAVRITKNPLALASAIVKVAQAGGRGPAYAANAAGDTVAAITGRVQRLLEDPGSEMERVRLPLVLASIVGLVLVTLYVC